MHTCTQHTHACTDAGTAQPRGVCLCCPFTPEWGSNRQSPRALTRGGRRRAGGCRRGRGRGRWRRAQGGRGWHGWRPWLQVAAPGRGPTAAKRTREGSSDTTVCTEKLESPLCFGRRRRQPQCKDKSPSTSLTTALRPATLQPRPAPPRPTSP